MGKTYPQSFLNRIVDEVDIEELANHYDLAVDSGRSNAEDVWTLCPFHHEKVPSFKITRTGRYKGLWKCFGKCRGKYAKGTLFKLVMLLEDCSFDRAVKILSKRYNVDNDYTDLHALATLKDKAETELFFEEHVGNKQVEQIPIHYWSQPTVWNYLHKRRNIPKGMVLSVATRFKIGLTNYHEQECLAIPLYDSNGHKVSTFVNGIYRNWKHYAKNSKVSEILFGMNLLESRQVILVEGIWDCLPVLSWGYPCTTSFTCGVTDKQLELITENFDRVFICYDNDEDEDVHAKVASKVDDIIANLDGIVDCTRLELPEGIKDPGECPRQVFVKLLKDSGWGI